MVYGLIPADDPAGTTFGALALAGPNTGRIVASAPIADPVMYAHVPVGTFGNTPEGVVDRSTRPGSA